MLSRSGLGCLSMVNSKAFVHHWGGTSRVYGAAAGPQGAAKPLSPGTNPMAFGFPSGAGEDPVVWDQASSRMARGEVQYLKPICVKTHPCDLDPSGIAPGHCAT